MNAVATIEAPKQAKPPIATGGKLAAIVPQDIEQAFRLSQAIANSGMAPKSYGNEPNKILVGILAGMEIGLTPMTALQSIAVIGNNPAIWGDGALALVQGSGLLTDFEETDDGNEATCRAVREGNPTPIIRSFSMDDAKRAGLAGKAGPWTQYPRRMRQMRARLLVLRDGFADVLKGIRIAEEVRDYPPSAFDADVAPAPRLTRQALADHASDIDQRPEDEISEAEYETVADTNSEQTPSSPGASSSREGETASALDTNEAADEMDGAAASTQSPLWQRLIDAANNATDDAMLCAVQSEFDESEAAIPLDRLSEVQDAINAADERINSKGE